MGRGEEGAPVGDIEDKALDNPGNETQQPQFDWLKQWYPLASVADLPTDRPTPVRLLGNPVVLWKDGDGDWRAFKDLCPHR